MRFLSDAKFDMKAVIDPSTSHDLPKQHSLWHVYQQLDFSYVSDGSEGATETNAPHIIKQNAASA